MPKRRRRSKKAAAPSGEDDRISALPDALLLTVLASLPSEEAVRTCVLSRRWRHLWKSTPAVRVFRDGDTEWCTTKLKNFLNNLLYLRDPLPLDECDISCSQLLARDDHEELLDFAESWVRKAVTLYQARVVRICICTGDYYLDLLNFPFVSQRLVRMELTRALLQFRNLDFSGCPALEDLELSHCTIYTDRILSLTLRRLSITGGFLDERTPRTRIAAPGLISLRLAGVCGRAFFSGEHAAVGRSICQA